MGNGSRMRGGGGFTIIAVLLIALTLFSLVSLALSANCRLRVVNRRLAAELQVRADDIRVAGP